MLHKGLTQHSVSSFASPVLLFKKKDGSWCFCVDYLHLNAITVKNKHPLPIVDELLDELAGAQWFSKLDFHSGYHLIRVAVGDEPKTTFRTHSGLYEFKDAIWINKCACFVSEYHEQHLCSHSQEVCSDFYG